MRLDVATFTRIHLSAILFLLIGAGWLCPVALQAQIISESVKQGKPRITQDPNGIAYYMRYSGALNAATKRRLLIITAKLGGVWVSMPDQPVRFAHEDDDETETADIKDYWFDATFYPSPDGKWLCVDRKMGTGFNVLYLYRRATGKAATTLRPVYPDNHRFDEAAWLHYARVGHLSHKLVSKTSRTGFYRLFTRFDGWSKDSKRFSYRLFSENRHQYRFISGRFDVKRGRFRIMKFVIENDTPR